MPLSADWVPPSYKGRWHRLSRRSATLSRPRVGGEAGTHPAGGVPVARGGCKGGGGVGCGGLGGRCDDIARDAELDVVAYAWREEVGPQRHRVSLLVHVGVRVHGHIRKVDVGVGVPRPHRTQLDDEARRVLEVEPDRLLLHQLLTPARRGRGRTEVVGLLAVAVRAGAGHDDLRAGRWYPYELAVVVKLVRVVRVELPLRDRDHLLVSRARGVEVEEREAWGVGRGEGVG
eukprot:scaffold4956_cov51-Phaeocystis_antarctica.AAC.1